MGFIFGQKLRKLKKKIIRWNKEDFERLEISKNKYLAKIQKLDMLEQERQLSEEERVIKGEAIFEYSKLLKMEEISWRQKSRVSWLMEGDRNTRFFHKVTNIQNQNNGINKLKVGDVWVEDKESIGPEAIHYFMEQYFEPLQT